jgi:hypothetical protein
MPPAGPRVPVTWPPCAHRLSFVAFSEQKGYLAYGSCGTHTPSQVTAYETLLTKHNDGTQNEMVDLLSSQSGRATCSCSANFPIPWRESRTAVSKQTTVHGHGRGALLTFGSNRFRRPRKTTERSDAARPFAFTTRTSVNEQARR